MLVGILDVAIVCMLIVLNGLFAMSEFAVVSSRKSRLQHRSEEGDPRAQAALELAENPTRFLATTQIGITLVGVLSGAFGGASIAKILAQPLSSIPYIGQYSDTLALTLVVSLITYFSLLSELVPKRIALTSPEGIASSVAGPMKLLSRIAFPAIRVLSASTEFLLRLVRFRAEKEPPVTEEEIRILIGQATVAGVFQEAEQDMVERIFRLGDRRVGVMMTPRDKIVWLDINESAEKIMRKITKSHYSRFPVSQGRLGNVLGVVNVRDLTLGCLAGKRLDIRGSVRKPIFVHESTHALKVLELFRESGLRQALVIDEYGTIEGIVTLSDILEAIVGDMTSTEVLEEPRIVKRADESWLVDGMLPIDELKDHFDIRKLPGERGGLFRTLSGFAMANLKRIPTAGDWFDCCGYRFEVVDMDRRRVDKVLIKKLEDKPAGQSGERQD